MSLAQGIRKGYARDTQRLQNAAQHTRNICATYAEREKDQVNSQIFNKVRTELRVQK